MLEIWGSGERSHTAPHLSSQRKAQMLTEFGHEFRKSVKISGCSRVNTGKKEEEMSKGRTSAAQKSETAWITWLKSDDPAAVDRAMTVLHDQHQPWLVRYMRAKLPTDYVEDTVQETWLSFYQAVRAYDHIDTMQGLLRRIAQRRRADAVAKVAAEREIEQDLFPLDVVADGTQQRFAADLSIEEVLDALATRTRVDEFRATLPYFPYTETLLSDCQRVFWALREQCNYPAKVVARLMDRKENNINAQISKARRQVLRYYLSDEFTVAWTNRAMPHVWAPATISAQAVFIEHFAERAIPQLTPEELKPLGLTLDDLARGYEVALMLPRWLDADDNQQTAPPYLVLTRKADWAEMTQHLARMTQDPTAVPDDFPEQAFIEIHLEHDDIELRVAPIHQMVADDPEYSVNPDTYLATHAPRVRVPVILAPYSDDLYTPDLLARWPFVKAADATGEGRDVWQVKDGQVVGKSRPG